MSDILKTIRDRDPHEKEFHQAVQEVIESVQPILEQNPQYLQDAVLQRITEPERVITFRIPWLDDRGNVNVHRGFSIEMNSAIGPYKGGLRFHPSAKRSAVIMGWVDMIPPIENPKQVIKSVSARSEPDKRPKNTPSPVKAISNATTRLDSK